MGTVGTLGVVVVGDVHIAIQVVIAERCLLIEVQILSSQLGVTLVNIQLGQFFSHFCSIQQIEVCHILFVADTGASRIVLQCIGECLRIKGLMVGVQTGVDHGDTGAATGVTGFPHVGGAGHAGRNHHIGLCNGAALFLGGIVAIFQNHLLNAGDLFNILDLTILHIGRDQVCSQGQVPDHIQLLAHHPFDLGSNSHLVVLQLIPIVHSCSIGCNACGRETGMQRGFLRQNDGNTNDLVICIGHCVMFALDLLRAERIADGTVVRHFKADTVFGGSTCRNKQTYQHNQNQQHGDQPSSEMVSHNVSPLILIFPERMRRPVFAINDCRFLPYQYGLYLQYITALFCCQYIFDNKQRRGRLVFQHIAQMAFVQYCNISSPASV